MQQDERTDADGRAAQGARVGGQVGTAVGAAVGTAVEEAVQRASEAATALNEGYGVVREKVAAADTGALVKQLSDVRDRVAAVDTGALVRQVGDVLEGVVEDGRGRALSALGRRQAPSRKWPWAISAAVAGAAAGAAVAFAVRRLVGQDAPGAQEPEHLRAVVDTGILVPGPVDEVPGEPPV